MAAKTHSSVQARSTRANPSATTRLYRSRVMVAGRTRSASQITASRGVGSSERGSSGSATRAKPNRSSSERGPARPSSRERSRQRSRPPGEGHRGSPADVPDRAGATRSREPSREARDTRAPSRITSANCWRSSPARERLTGGPGCICQVASNSHAITWEPGPYPLRGDYRLRGLSGVFLPSLRRFTIPVPSNDERPATNGRPRS
jgi:hypothetical protein